MPRLRWIDPLKDSRWLELTKRHPRATVFHSPGWLEALRRTYGYQPTALTIETPQGDLAAGLVFCRVTSPLTRRRLVSLPFTDHCDSLFETDADSQALMEGLRDEQATGGWSYVEWRPRDPTFTSPFGRRMEGQYWLHRFDLSVGLNALRQSFHPNHVLRKIRRSEREGLVYAEGRSQALLDVFFKLFVATRRRHGVPPQPYQWFRNVLDCLPDAARLRVATTSNGTPVAAILTLRDRDAMIFKYGGSDRRFQALGGMQLLLWRTIQDAHQQGCVTMDLGRSDVANAGLVAFKEHWGATRYPLIYWRHPAPRAALAALERATFAMARRAVTLVPDRLLIAVGKLLYPHIG